MSGGRSQLRNMSPSPSVHDQALTPPNPPFSALRPISMVSSSTISPSSSKQDVRNSLSVNYLPSKFSRPHSPGVSYRKANSKNGGLVKRGGGRDAFAAGASRMPGNNDEDYDGVAVDGWFQQNNGKGKKPRLRWNRFKWVLFFTNTMVRSSNNPCLPFV